ncbi:kynurenine 3-monooxygenase [Tremella mesenterica]|uniref:Kynurenine 3-monooxygenase n=1 Tax=Tremella mesenterica TaxID=5217 RepID=A0A4Q1BFG3_TREME|nr:kynurenine 3-monooxygenase [Tremella mesenterica]
MSSQRQRVALVIGAGPVGALAALSLHRRGWDVEIWEARDDPRGMEASKMTNLRSINLNISARGLEAMRSVDPTLAETMINESIPMASRMIHHLDGHTEAQAYDPIHGWHSNSISRPVLNQRLVEALPLEIKMRFNTKLSRLDLHSRKAYFTEHGEEEEVKDFDLIIGADGTWSKVRQEMKRVERVNFSQEFISHAYIELHMPPDPTKAGGFKMEPNHLHIWPRHSFMLIALPNKDGSFTMTLFIPFEEAKRLDTRDGALAFFQEHFSSAIDLMGKERLLDDLERNPRGNLVTMNVNPSTWRSHVVLLGDAAHSMVPFYGQGLNCGLEDVRVLNSYLEQHHIGSTATAPLGRTDPELSMALETYSKDRDADLRAICTLALNNYTEMRSHVLSPLYQFRRHLDYVLERLLPSKPEGELSLTNPFPTRKVRGWTSLYEMVTFRADIGYAEALRREKWQREVVSWAGEIAAIGLVGGIGVMSWLLFRQWER